MTYYGIRCYSMRRPQSPPAARSPTRVANHGRLSKAPQSGERGGTAPGVLELLRGRGWSRLSNRSDSSLSLRGVALRTRES